MNSNKMPIGDWNSTPNKGWQCPQCNKIYSPNTYECHACNNKPLNPPNYVPYIENDPPAHIYPPKVLYWSTCKKCKLLHASQEYIADYICPTCSDTEISCT